MIVTVVNFPLPQGMSNDDAGDLFKASVPRYEGLPGLIRKYYLVGQGDKAGIGGGVYLWESRAAADALYTDQWRDSIRERFGAAPVIDYYDTPVIVENG